MEKSELRKIYLEKRKTLSNDDILLLSQKIFNNFISDFKLFENQKIHCFLPILNQKEIDTYLFINYFFKNNIKVFVPKIINEKLISIQINNDTTLIKNSWGISEPESNEDSNEMDFDFIITPLLYCDTKGNRIGYGKGFYDTFFQKINKNSIKIGVNFFEPKEKIDDILNTDIPLDYLVLPTETLSFGGFATKSTK